jgi:hypothetical protein
MVTHLTSDNHDLIEKIDGGPEQTGSWLQQHKDQANKKADELLKIEKSVDHRVAKTLHNQWIRKCNAKERGLNKAIDEQKSCDSIELLQPELQDLHKCKANDSTERGFGMMNRKIRGAKEFKDVVQVKEDAKTWKKNLGKMNEGIFLFMQSVRMMATERRQEIHDTACQAFSGTPKDAAMRCLITWWLEISEHLHEIGLLMKPREDDPDRLCSLKKHIILCVALHRKRAKTKNSIFWKAHVSLCCFVNFCKTAGMGGRSLAEGMENNHCTMGLIKATMQSIVNAGTRVKANAATANLFAS